MKAESKKVWKFIIEREIEAPARFQAIQTHRAAMAILRQQVPGPYQLLVCFKSAAIKNTTMQHFIFCLLRDCSSMHAMLVACHAVRGNWEMRKVSKSGVACDVNRFQSCPFQALFVEQLYSSGMVDEVERELLSEPIQKNERRLLRKNSLGLSHRLDEVPLTCHLQSGSAASILSRLLGSAWEAVQWFCCVACITARTLARHVTSNVMAVRCV